MDQLLTKEEVAEALKLSENTIKSNPAKYHMFKVGGVWRATKQDVANYIDESRKKHNNVIRLALGKGNNGGKKCRYSRGMMSTISTSGHPAVKELKNLLG